MWTTLNFRVRGKTIKTARDICERTLDLDFERDRSIGLRFYVRQRTDRHIHTQIFFLKHFLRMWEWHGTENHQKIEVEFLTIGVLPTLLMSLESKNARICSHAQVFKALKIIYLQIIYSQCKFRTSKKNSYLISDFSSLSYSLKTINKVASVLFWPLQELKACC